MWLFRILTCFRIQKDPPSGVSGAPSDDNIMEWDALIFGPENTPFEDGTFKLKMVFTEEYPNKPPLVKFISAMFHPNGMSDCVLTYFTRSSMREDGSAVSITCFITDHS